jgi:transcription initiation factor TFIIIB Brf1 subunit/transcription initiation factor TFIIB
VSSSIVEYLRSRLSHHGQQSNNVENTIKCPHCGNEKLVTDYERGEVVCPRCGTVVVEHLVDVTRPEYRIFGRSEDIERVHYESSVDLVMPYSGAHVREIVKTIDISIVVAKSVHVSSSDWSIYAHIKKFAHELNLDNTFVQTVYTLCKTVRDELRGRRRVKYCDVLVAAIIYALRPDLYNELVKILERRHGLYAKRRLTQCVCMLTEYSQKYREVLRVSLMRYTQRRLDDRRVARAIDLLREVLKSAGADDNTVIEAARLYKQLLSTAVKILQTRRLDVILATCLYIVVKILNLSLRQKDVAKMLGVSDLAIRYAYRELFRTQMASDQVHVIRNALNQELVLGRDGFKDKIEQMTQRQTRRGKDGRPKIEESSGMYYIF